MNSGTFWNSSLPFAKEQSPSLEPERPMLPAIAIRGRVAWLPGKAGLLGGGLGLPLLIPGRSQVWEGP